jgi:putative PIN family toxin of toxin-antitoxin system
MAIKAVLDTNIWISAIIKGKMADLLGIAVSYDVEFLRCKQLDDEIKEVLGREKIGKYLTEPVSHYISIFESATKTVRIRHEFSGCRDPKDNYLFDLAIQAKAKYIVSGDRDVSETQVGSQIEIVTLTKFKEKLKQSLN